MKPISNFKDIYLPLPDDPEVDQDILNLKSAKLFNYIKVNETTYLCETSKDKEKCWQDFSNLK